MASENLWTTCQACGKQIAVRANVCLHCGHKLTRSRRLKWATVGLVSLTVFAALIAPDKPDQNAGGTKTSVPATTSKTAIVSMPEKQLAFIAIISEYERRFASAANELQQNAFRYKRREAIMASLGPQLRVSEWVGTLRKLETNGDGKAVIAVRIAPDVDLLTWNNSLSDSLHGTLIDKGTQLYGVLMDMAVGDKVKVAGNFFPADADGVFENSMTIRGAMTAPEFLFKFTDISK
ncbi:zinc ribbon domain-containing protein [Agrobacterium genomosp. 3]|uniref:zinc ribbon domain-containing protein n=1 Tax=Agrobacterium tomkonis TaxID=1183410 RepID=UPI001CD90F27|nr:zinc ribbon domain-containing protein [Agrobacterium tomkonis]MCA1877979.1 zinc ribbon domain-containing protein [Agrobacterium tumefaciens]MCA1893204.1 zinc ribbon domain-containing protein [Agrobacterium tomkonis]